MMPCISYVTHLVLRLNSNYVCTHRCVIRTAFAANILRATDSVSYGSVRGANRREDLSTSDCGHVARPQHCTNSLSVVFVSVVFRDSVELPEGGFNHLTPGG